MDRKISFSTYRSIDIAIFTLLMIIFEFLSIKGFEWLNGIYSLSLFLVISLITMLRWKFWAIIPIIASGITYSLAHQDGTYQNMIVYSVGNLFSLLSLVWIFPDQKKLEKNHFVILFVLTGFFSYCVGRSFIASIIFQKSFADLLIGFLGTESLNAVISLVVIFIAKRQNGILEDQKKYILRVQEEERNISLEVEE